MSLAATRLVEPLTQDTGHTDTVLAVLAFAPKQVAWSLALMLARSQSTVLDKEHHQMIKVIAM